MRNYAMVAPFFWTRGAGKRLRGKASAQVVAMYLSTCPDANLIGLYYLPRVKIEHETGLTPKQVLSAIEDVEEAGYASYDRNAEIVWIPNSAQFELGRALKAGDKRRAKVLAELRLIGRHHFVGAFLGAYGEGYKIDAEDIFGSDGRGIEGASKGHPGVETTLDGASAILGPVPSGSISNPVPFPRSENARGEGGGTERPRRTRPPEGPPASDAVRAWASEWGIPHEHAKFAQFLHHHRASAVPIAVWSEAWSAWCEGARALLPGPARFSGQPLAGVDLAEPEDLYVRRTGA